MQVLSHIVYSWSLFLITFYMDIELCHTVYCTLLHLYIAFTNDFPLLSSTFFMAKQNSLSQRAFLKTLFLELEELRIWNEKQKTKK